MSVRSAAEGLFNPAGGVVYHMRALRHGRRRWAPFRESLARWLAQWEPPEQELIVVGPSAGHTLPFSLFDRFRRLTLVEPDPLARWLFRRKLHRHGWFGRTGSLESDIEWLTQDILLAEPERFGEHLPVHAAILYANVLGQLVHLVDSSLPQMTAVKAAVRDSLEGRSFASYHDRWSSQFEPEDTTQALNYPRRATDAQLSEHYLAAKTAVEVVDHDTGEFFDPELPHSYFCWELKPRYFHLVEATCRSLA